MGASVSITDTAIQTGIKRAMTGFAKAVGRVDALLAGPYAELRILGRIPIYYSKEDQFMWIWYDEFQRWEEYRQIELGMISQERIKQERDKAIQGRFVEQFHERNK